MHLQEEVSLQPGPAHPAPSSAPHSTPAVTRAGLLLRPHHSLGDLQLSRRDSALLGQPIHFAADTSSEMILLSHLIDHVTTGRRKMLTHDQYFLEPQLFSRPQ